MKVALFSRYPTNPDAPRGGVETVTLALSRALAEMDDLEVHVVTLERGREEIQIDRYGHVTVHRLPASRFPQMLDIIRGPGRKRLREYLASLGPDVVHFHETYGLGIGTLDVPVVFTVHGFDHANIPAERRAFSRLRSPIWRQIEKWGLARQKDIISITPYVRSHITPLTNARIHDIENPLDPAFFDIQRNTAKGRIFFAGWIMPRKNPLTLVEAVGKLAQMGVDAHAHLAGEEKDADYAAKVKARIKELNVADRVTLLGRISPDAIRRELSEAAVLVLPSLQENAPMAISEAMAAGVPVIASNRCGMVYMVEEGQTGYLADPEDADTLAQRLQTLLTDEALWQKMSTAARASAYNRFHPETVARRTREVYEMVMRN